MNWFRDIQFANPELFVLFALVPLMILWYIVDRRKARPFLKISTLSTLKFKGKDFKVWSMHLPFILEMLAVCLLIVCLARPQSSLSWQDVKTEGIDIVIALDISGSMLAEDLKPNRLEASKQMAVDFIDGRPNDRIGIVIFSGESFTQSPLTTDHDVLKNLFMDIKNGMVEDGTAIGMGLATSVNRLRNSEAKSKVVILLTDGFNTTGSIAPITAGEIAREFGIRVYTIGVGAIGQAPYPFTSRFGTTHYEMTEVKIDEPTMKEISNITGGKYFRATNNRTLKAIYEEIDQLEKSKIAVTEYRRKNEEYFPFALAAGLILVLGFSLKNSIYKSIT